MIILIDNQEKLPLDFSHIKELLGKDYVRGVERVHLTEGDYGCRYSDGYVPPVYFERKSKSDLFGSLSKGYTRFKKEINRSIDNKYQLIIIIEESLMSILKGVKHSKRSGISVAFQLYTLWIKHGIRHICCKDRTEMALKIVLTYKAIDEQR